MKKNDLLIVMYHYIRDSWKTEYPGIKACSISKFNRQINQLLKSRKPTSFKEIIESGIKGNQFILTFDDGLKDHFSNAFPILKKKEIIGCFNTPTQPLEEKIVLDVHKIHFLSAKLGKAFNKKVLNKIYKINKSVLSLKKSEIMASFRVYPYDNEEDRKIKYILNYKLENEIKHNILEELFNEVIPDSHNFSKELYLSWDEIKEMHEEGMEFGAHSHRHLVLSHLDKEEMYEDIVISKKLIETKLKSRLNVFCYPYGDKYSFNNITISIIKKLGFSFGVSAIKGINEKYFDNFRIRRMDTKEL